MEKGVRGCWSLAAGGPWGSLRLPLAFPEARPWAGCEGVASRVAIPPLSRRLSTMTLGGPLEIVARVCKAGPHRVTGLIAGDAYCR